MKISFTLNGAPVSVETAPDRRVIDLLREDLLREDLLREDPPREGLLREDLGAAPAQDADTGAGPALEVKEGCGTGECGACSILVDGVHKLSCLMLAAQLEGRAVATAAGLGTRQAPHAVQKAFAEHGAVQCGFCSPGMAVAAAALLAANPEPTRQDIRRGLSGNLCRCTGYVKIIDAVEAAAATLRKGEGE